MKSRDSRVAKSDPATTASGVKRTNRPKKDGGESKVERPASAAIGMAISPSLLERNPDRTAKRATPTKEQISRRESQRRVAEKSSSSVASRGAASVQRIRPIHPQQPIASGVKRGRKRHVVLEQRGWGIYNKKASYLVDEFFRRKTDAINHLEREQKQPWSAIKHKDELKPVPVKIIIMDKEIINLANASKTRQV